MINITMPALRPATERYVSTATEIPKMFQLSMDDMGRYTLDVLKKTVNVRSGALRDSLRYKLEKTSNGYQLTFEATARSTFDQAYYGNYVDQGTPPHSIKIRNKRALHFFDKSGNEIFAQMVYHPGYKGSQFTSKAVQQASKRADTVLKSLGRSIGKRVAM